MKEFFRHLKFLFINRFITKSHALTSHDLKRGEFHDLDKRIIYCLFDSLVDFVEKELAWEHLILSGGKRPLNFLHTWRSREHGLARLEWEASLTSGITLTEYPERPIPQAVSAQEILCLYLWWTEERPMRLDPFKLRSIERFLYLEKEYATEDEAMLIRLIKIRTHLWT